MSNLGDNQRINKIIYQSWHRGCKETDIILGDFAKSEVAGFDDTKLATYEALIAEDDWDIYNWFVEKDKTPKKYQELISEIKLFSERKLSLA